MLLNSSELFCGSWSATVLFFASLCQIRECSPWLCDVLCCYVLRKRMEKNAMDDSPGSGGDAGDQSPILAMIQNMLLTMSADMKAELSSVKSDLTRVMSDVQELTKKVAVGSEEGESPEIKGEQDGQESSQELKANISVVVPVKLFFFLPFPTLVLGIRIWNRIWIRMFLGLPDPDPLVRGADPSLLSKMC
jgi:hypothetical protein